MSGESLLQVRPKDGNSSLSISAARSGLIARGPVPAEITHTQRLASEWEAERNSQPESERHRA